MPQKKKQTENKTSLTPKQKTFVEEYLIDLNATQAAIRAGYSGRSAKQIASQTIDKAHVASAIEKAMAERSRRTGINAERVVQELARVAFVDPTAVIDPDTAMVRPGVDVDDRAAIASVRVKVIPTQEGDITEREVKLADKLRALELLGKHLGIFAAGGAAAMLGAQEDDPLTISLKEAMGDATG